MIMIHLISGYIPRFLKGIDMYLGERLITLIRKSENKKTKLPNNFSKQYLYLHGEFVKDYVYDGTTPVWELKNNCGMIPAAMDQLEPSRMGMEHDEVGRTTFGLWATQTIILSSYWCLVGNEGIIHNHYQ